MTPTNPPTQPTTPPAADGAKATSDAIKLGSASFTDRQPFLVTSADILKPWSGGKNGEYFRCGLCGHKFEPGDVARWEYTNDTPGAGSNPLVCQKCDGPRKEIISKIVAIRADFRSPRFWSLRRSLP